ncbi:MAG: molybdenum cofactor guanylyltransferase MobA [Alsobacter sp.]
MREDKDSADRPSGPQDPAVAARVLGVVLAGGRSTRMGREKAFVPLGGKPLLAHVLAALSPQVGRVAINANGDPSRFSALGCAVFPDEVADAGPLAGIVAGLRHAAAEQWEAVATCPSDAPFLPRDLVERLWRGLGHRQAACVRTPAGLEPLFAVWRAGAWPAAARALREGRLAVRDALADVGFVAVDWPDPAPFANLNTPEELARAAGRAP